MLMERGTTNGFRFSSGLAGRLDKWKQVDCAVVPYWNGYYAMCGRNVARNVAERQKAFGFWRIKRNG